MSDLPPDELTPHDGELERNLGTLLEEANNRSRWYASQLWQVPFAYLGLTLLALSAFFPAEDGNEHPDSSLRYALCAFAVFGILVLIHQLLAYSNQRRAVDLLRVLEKHAGLPRRYRAAHSPVALPMIGTTILAILVFLVAWCKLD